jgi:hypothetical protein
MGKPKAVKGVVKSVVAGNSAKKTAIGKGSLDRTKLDLEDPCSAISAKVRSLTKIPSTSRQYDGYAVKFFLHLKLGLATDYNPFKVSIPQKYWEDEILAHFIIDLGETCGWKIAQRKSAMAMINQNLQYFGLKNCYDFKHEYRWLTQALEVNKHLLFILALNLTCFQF